MYVKDQPKYKRLKWNVSSEIFWPILSKPYTTQSAKRHVLRHVLLFFPVECEQIPMENILNTERMTTRTHQYSDFYRWQNGLSTVPIAKWLCMLSKKKKSLFIFKSIRFLLLFFSSQNRLWTFWSIDVCRTRNFRTEFGFNYSRKKKSTKSEWK